jgi:serralysin
MPDNEPIEVPSFVRPEPLDGQVFRVYHSHFLRAPDRRGFEYWVEQRAAGTDLGSMVSAFANGSEFQQRYGTLSDHQFVALVYRNVLGREADARGLTHWVGQLGAGMTRVEVMIGFIESAEYVTRTGTTPGYSSVEGSTRRLYQAFFLRQPDSDGLAHWVSVANSGSSWQSIAQSFASSAEFQQRYGSLDNEEFVQLVYQNVLNRNPDSGGYSHWVKQLNAGMRRGQMMVGFSQSPEFILATGTLP